MKGYIKKILSIDSSNKEYGYIKGEDGKDYYFDDRSIPNGLTTYNFYEGDFVVFEVIAQPLKKCDRAYNLCLKSNTNIQTVTTSPTAEKKEITVTPIEFYGKGYFKHIDKVKMRTTHLKQGSGEAEILDKLSKLLYISHVNHHDVGHNTLFPFCLIGATEFIKQYVRGKYEFLLVFSHFDNKSWQQSTLKAVYHIRHRKDISDRRPLVNFYVLISNAKTLIQEINKMKGGTSAAIIPFTFEEILGCTNTVELSKLILSRFDEFLFENNMLGEETPIEEDTLLFGDRGKIADSIVQRSIEKKHSGIFGLRRSGKSSVLRAVARRFEQSNIKYVVLQARSDLENVDSWKTALFDIARKVRIEASGIIQEEGESRHSYNERLNLSSTEEDYKKRPTQCFVEDIKFYTKNLSCFVIAIDEVELITYNTATSPMWQDIDSYKGFWGALRDSECSLIICGVNSTINEKSTITYRGKSCDNPMYERIHNCAGFSKAYLPTFTDEQTKEMINTLGSYSNISFSNVYVDINRAFGGQPYAIRQFCSFVFDNVKAYRNHGEIYQVTKPTFNALITQFNNSEKGRQLFNTILQHIQIYGDEYEMLKGLALAPEKHRAITAGNSSLIDHLEKYGLIEFDRTTGYVTFNIDSIREYICKNAEKRPEDMTNDERRQYVQDKVKICESKLKRYILNVFTYRTANARHIINKYISNKIIINPKAKPAPNTLTCDIKDFFDHKLFIFYFSTLKIIIRDNWANFNGDFMSCGISKDNFTTYMDDLNAGRTDADHYDPENSEFFPNNWEINNETLLAFSSAYEKMNTFFKKLNL